MEENKKTYVKNGGIKIRELDELKEIGIDDFFTKQIECREKNLMLGRISQVHRSGYIIMHEHGEIEARLKGKNFYSGDSEYTIYPAVGDVVLFEENDQLAIIYRVLERKSYFSRSRPGMKNLSNNKTEQIIAANVDYAFIMESLNDDFNIRRLERYITAAWNSGAEPVIILTKADLCLDVDEYIDKASKIAFGIDIYAISSETGFGLDKLNQYFVIGKTSVLLGSSGIGKSTLVNAIANDQIMKVSGIRSDDAKGRHTTTYRHMIKLPNNSIIIDTPGMREFSNEDFDISIDKTFEDIAELSNQCKFTDCKHDSEPGCAVKKAIEEGLITEKRLKSYNKMLRESERMAKKYKKDAKRKKQKK